MTTCARKNDFIALFCTSLTFAHILFQMLDYIGVKMNYLHVQPVCLKAFTL